LQDVLAPSGKAAGGMWAAVQAAAAAAAAHAHAGIKDLGPPAASQHKPDMAARVPGAGSGCAHKGAAGAMPPPPPAATHATGPGPAGSAGVAREGRGRPQQLRPSQLSMEEARLLGELQQLDRRMAGQGATQPPNSAAAALSSTSAALPALKGPQAAAGVRSGGRRDAPGALCNDAALPRNSGGSTRPTGAAKRKQAVPAARAPRPAGAGVPSSAAPLQLAAVRGATAGSSRGSSRSGDDTVASRSPDAGRMGRSAAVTGPAHAPAAGSSAGRGRVPQSASAISSRGVREPRPAGGRSGAAGVRSPQRPPHDAQQQQPWGSPGAMPAHCMQLAHMWPDALAGSPAGYMGMQGMVQHAMPLTPYMHPGMWPQQAAMLQQSLWAAHMQQQQFGSPYHLQQHPASALLCPYTPAGVPRQLASSRPGTGPHGTQQQPPGSPLLPTLHYQQTVMRDRTASRGGMPCASTVPASAPHAPHGEPAEARAATVWGSSSGGAGSSRTSSAVAGPPAGVRTQAGARPAADVWPLRRMDSSVGRGAGRRAGGGDGDDVVVCYAAQLMYG
jgi:hypothetical protein